ncbi:MAG TPA: LptF/LptG family permease, partial [Verrucomicrobiota bacterium]|nr:LptF/LptG family permease [Verrucomicrobiota bacterium]
SLWRVAAPYFAVGASASLLLFILNETWIPGIQERALRIKTSHIAKHQPDSDKRLEKNFGFRNGRDARSWQAAVYDRETSMMTNASVSWTLADGSHRWILAERAGPTNGAWMFYNARLYRDDSGTNTAPVPVLATNALFMAQFTETPAQINSALKVSRRMSFKNVREVEIPLVELLDFLRFNPHPSRSDRYMVHTQIHGRLAAPWACLVVVFISLPLGAASGRKNVFAGVAGSIFVCVAYIAARDLALALGAGGYVAPWLAAWTPNVLFATAGAWLTARAR